MTSDHKLPAAYPRHLVDSSKLAANILGGTRDAITSAAGAAGEFVRRPTQTDDSPYAGVLGKLRWAASRPHAMYSDAKYYKDVVSSDDYRSALPRAYNHAFTSDRLRDKQITDYSPKLYGAGDAFMDAGILGLSGAAALRMARGPYRGPVMPRSKGRLGIALGLLGAAGMYGASRANAAQNWRRSGLGTTSADGTALPNNGGDFDNYRARSRHYQEALNRIQAKNVVPSNG